MPLLKTCTNPCLGIWKIEESWESLLRLTTRQEEHLALLDRFQSERRKCEWLAVRVLLKELLGEEPLIAYRPSGAPYLPGSSYHLSISHTKGYAAVLLSDQRPVGIDIEYLSDRVRRIASRFLSVKELAILGDAPSLHQLLLCWSAKESLFKMLSIPSVDLRRDFSLVSPPGDDVMGRITIRENISTQGATFELHYQVTSDYVLTYSG